MSEERGAKALALHLAGVDWYTIAGKLKYADAADACEEAMAAAEAQYDGPPADPQRILEILRINRLQAAAWPAAMKGELDAISTVVSLGDRRARYLRLNQRSRD